MKIGITELIVVFVVALFVVGPDKLPLYAKKLGEALTQFKKYSEAATKDIKESIVEPLEEAQKPLREAMEPLNELDQAVRGNVKEVQKSFKEIGRGKKDADAGGQNPKTEKEAADEEALQAAEAVAVTETDTGDGQTLTDTDAGIRSGASAEEMKNTAEINTETEETL